MIYDCMIVGGGIAGLQAAIQLGRYQHTVLVVDSAHGRSVLCRNYHNILGWPDGVSGQKLRQIGRQQAEELGVVFVEDEINSAVRVGASFRARGQSGSGYEARRMLLATGILDRIPILPELVPCLGVSVYVCPDCDGYEVKNRRTLVLGAGNTGANMALTLQAWTEELIYVNHEQTPVDRTLLERLQASNIPYVEDAIQEVLSDGANIRGVVLHNGETLAGGRAFVAFGGNTVRSALAKQLGADVLENNHIPVNPRTKMTSAEHVWAAGDVAAHSEQVTIAMGDGSQAAIWIHKSLVQ